MVLVNGCPIPIVFKYGQQALYYDKIILKDSPGIFIQGIPIFPKWLLPSIRE